MMVIKIFRELRGLRGLRGLAATADIKPLDIQFKPENNFNADSSEYDWDAASDYDRSTLGFQMSCKEHDMRDGIREGNSNINMSDPAQRPVIMNHVNNYGITNFTHLKFIQCLEKTNMMDGTMVESFSVGASSCDVESFIKIFDNESYAGDRIGFRQVIDEENSCKDMFLVYENIYFKGTLSGKKMNIQIGAPDSEIISLAKKHLTFSTDKARYCQWHFAKGAEIYDLRLPIKEPKPCSSRHVPWVTGGVEEFCKSYMDSQSSILIMLGPPGTGKTSLINHIIANHNREAMITYDRSVMARDDFYIDFISNDRYNMLILEDADPILHRKEGERSEVLSKILNVGDGLVDITNKKIIITANLESIEDIDPAIARKGRCFDILMSRPMTISEAERLAKSEDLDSDFDQEITLAEFYNGMNKVRRSSRKFGFSI